MICVDAVVREIRHIHASVFGSSERKEVKPMPNAHVLSKRDIRRLVAAQASLAAILTEAGAIAKPKRRRAAKAKPAKRTAAKAPTDRTAKPLPRTRLAKNPLISVDDSSAAS